MWEVSENIAKVVKRVERVEAELKKQSSVCSSSDSTYSPGSKKLHVPTVMRVSSAMKID